MKVYEYNSIISNYLPYICALSILAFSGCKSKLPEVKPLDSKPTLTITETNKSLVKSTDIIFQENAAIRGKSEAIITKSLEPETKQKAVEIQKASTVIEMQKPLILNAVQTYDLLKTDVKKLEDIHQNTLKIVDDKDKIISSKDKDIEELKSASYTWMQRSLQFFILAGTLLVAFSMYMLFTGNAKAISLTVAGGALIISAMGVSVITKLMWLWTGLVIASVIALTILVFMQIKEWYKSKKSLVEVIKSVEQIKASDILPEVKDKIFGDGKILDSIQSAETKAIVKEIRGK
jgi:hypothetical protein